MDVDDSPAATQQNDDIELLTMFSCMGTEEKDNLVQQFQYIGNEPSQATAKFFLDMNNWWDFLGLCMMCVCLFIFNWIVFVFEMYDVCVYIVCIYYQFIQSL